MTPAATGELRVWTTADPAEWAAVLAGSARHDFCHLASTHRAAEQHGEGTAYLFEYRQGSEAIALPLLLRPVPGSAGADLQEATSVYGYGGPVVPRGGLAPELVDGFQRALVGELRARSVVSVFSRMHPLVDSGGALHGLGHLRPAGQTISIDLTDPDGHGEAGYSKGCRRTLRKLAELGFVGVHDQDMQQLPAFGRIYRETMQRADAAEDYRYSDEYFAALANELGEILQLFLVELDGRPVAGALVTRCDGIVQDFLGGTLDEFRRHSPDRLVVDTERRWAAATGAEVLHLGGGRGVQDDSLLAYKAGFSPRRHTFATWRLVVDEAAYRDLVTAVGRPVTGESAAFFPEYRSPLDGASGRHQDSASPATA